MNTLPPRHKSATTSNFLGVPVPRRRLRISRPWRGILRWLPAISLLLLAFDHNLAAEVVGSPQSFATRPETVASPPWLAWQVVARSQATDTPQNLPEPNSDASALLSVANDGLKPLTQVTLDIQPMLGEVPPDVAAVKFAQAGRVSHPIGTCRPWHPSEFWWESPAFCHRPLYFEEVNLERYGYTCGVAQPMVSAAHFFGTIPAMPYLLAAENPCDCVYTLGHYLPGSCAPYQVHFPPPSLKGGLAEAAVMTGLIFVLP
jgi:hypothetical protein